MAASVHGAEPLLPRVMNLRDVVLFNITAIVGLRWLTTAAQFGPASILLWLLALVIFFLPSAAAVRELTDIDPGEGGIYRWVRRAFGPTHGFMAGWSYWVSNLVYFPSLLVTTAAMAAYAGGGRWLHLEDDKAFVAGFSLFVLWLALGMNLVGLRVGRWIQNLGAYGTWVPTLVVVVLAGWSWVRFGSATPFTLDALLPANLDYSVVSFFATMTFAFAGLELAPTLGGEIRDPAATLRRGIVLSGAAIVAMYVVGTLALLVALPAATVSITSGIPQAAAAVAERLGAAWLAPVAALVAILLVLGNVGGVGAWLAGTARIPFVAGVDAVLPPAFARVHPRWRTPHVALLVQAGVASGFAVVGLVGATVRDAYIALIDMTIVLYFIPYFYLFASYVRLRRRRTAGTWYVGWVGLGAVVLSIGLALWPSGVTDRLLFESKVIGGVGVFLAVGWWLARRAVRQRTALGRRGALA
ncbi:MAG TPA: APC family permease [Gemmatimonadales bacterium]|nr:APC family permease [Gemmatimonadales bacterium]